MALLDTHTQISAIIGDFGSGLDHPECIAWGCDGYAYAGGEAGQIYRIDLARRAFNERRRVNKKYQTLARSFLKSARRIAADQKVPGRPPTRIVVDGTTTIAIIGRITGLIILAALERLRLKNRTQPAAR